MGTSQWLKFLIIASISTCTEAGLPVPIKWIIQDQCE